MLTQYSLREIMHQALEDRRSIKTILSKGVTIIGRGVKLQQFEKKITILNMGKGGDYFKECDADEYYHFHLHGWKIGSIMISVDNCLYKLSVIESRIKTELNTRKNDKHIQNLKNRRENLLIKYTKLKNQLNQIQ